MFVFSKYVWAINRNIKYSGAYPTLEAAITDLNTQGVGVGGVTLNLLAANPQTAPAGGYVIGGAGSLVLTTASAANPIIITGNGNTITASAALTVGALNDAIFKLIGADWTTIQGFVMEENAANTTSTPHGSNNMTEWGVALLYESLTDGAKNNVFQNNTISLNRIYTNTFGIYSNVRHSATSPTTAAEVVTAAGSNSNNSVFSNTISNVNYGISFVGSGTAIAMDSDNNIGGNSLATANTITNWGGNISGAVSGYPSVTSSNACIYMNHQINDNVSYNTVVSATNITTLTTTGFLGIFKTYSAGQPTGHTFTSNYNSNTVTLTNAPTTSQMTAIGMQNLTTLSTATFNCNNNSIINCSHTGGGVLAAPMIGMLHSSAPGTFNITGNTIRGFSTNTTTTGGFIGIQQQTNGVVNALNINNNNIGDATAGAVTFNNTTTTATVNGIVVTSTGAATTCTVSIESNDFRGVTYITSGTGAHTYISYVAPCASLSISNNTFTNLNVNTTGTVTFIGHSYTIPSGATQTIHNNSIVTGFTKLGAGGSVIGMTSGASSINAASVFHTNNNFSNITVSGATTVTGIANSDGLSTIAYSRTVTGNIFNNWIGGTSAMTGY
jgi:hypothetical protein